MVDEIVAASQEQAQGVGEVSKAVMEMNKVTQQSAANAEESASAAEVLTGQMKQINEYVADLMAIVKGSGHQESSHYAMARAALVPKGYGRREDAGANVRLWAKGPAWQVFKEELLSPHSGRQNTPSFSGH